MQIKGTIRLFAILLALVCLFQLSFSVVTRVVEKKATNYSKSDYVMNQATDSLGEKIKKELSGASSRMSESLAEELEQYKVQIEELFEGLVTFLYGIFDQETDSAKRRVKSLVSKYYNNRIDALRKSMHVLKFFPGL